VTRSLKALDWQRFLARPRLIYQAAFKRVMLLEEQPLAAIENTFFGPHASIGWSAARVSA